MAALAEMYTLRLPLRSLYRVDRFGYSSRVRGGDDFASMASGNTSVFNCRDVVNNPGVRSPHAYGRAFDVNTWENPYRSARGTVPNTWWQSRSHPRVAWRSASHRVVEVMARHGLRWTYGLGDTQHFDAPSGSGRYAVSRRSAAASASDDPRLRLLRDRGGEVAADRVLENADFVGFLDQRPVFKGHVLLVPRTHVVTLPDLPAELRDGFLAAAQRLATAVVDVLGAQGSFVAVNNTVSQSVPHLHLHVVPRTKGDGLRGFFWPRTKYAGPEEQAEYAARLRSRARLTLP